MNNIAPFHPHKPEDVPEDYRVDEVSNAYADLWEEGLWVKEWGEGGDGFLCGVGSVYDLQRLEHAHPELGELDPQKFSLGDMMAVSLPGSGPTRVEAIRTARAAFMESTLGEKHRKWHEEVNS